jgi:hypothetical protein
MTTTELTKIQPAAPTTVADLQRLGGLLAASGYFRDARDMAQAAVKIQAGAELGIPPVAAMSSIYIVEGKPTLSAVLMGALVKRSGRYNYRVTDHTLQACTIAFFEGKEQIGVSTFTYDDAQAAGVARSPTWSKFRRNMLFARAMSNGCRWYCPDVFGGPIYTPEELGEQRVNADGEPLVVTAPKTAPVAAVESEPEPVDAVVIEPSPMVETDLRQAITGELDRLRLTGEQRKATVFQVLGRRPSTPDDLKVVLETLREYPAKEA